jgi:DNA-binding SARP family transcriptional activator
MLRAPAAGRRAREQVVAGMAGTISIALFGGFRIQTASGRSASGRRGPLRVLAYLLLHRAAAVPRATLAAALWPDSLDALAAAQLRKQLHFLRRELPEVAECLRVQAGEVAWADVSGLDVDVWRFQELTSASDPAALERAVACYAGDLLPDWPDEWLEVPRQALRTAFLRSLDLLAQTHLDPLVPDKALAYARRLYHEDPWSEAALRRLVEAYARCGDRGAAAAAFAHGVRRLREELGCEPDPVTLQLAVALGIPMDAAPPPRARRHPPAPPHPPVFVDRLAELERFRAFVQPEPPGVRILLVQGPGGSGKSTLLRMFAVEAEGLGLPTVWIDGRTLGGSEALLWERFGCRDLASAVARVEAEAPVVFLDHFEELGPLGYALRERLLPQVTAAVRLVVSGRYGYLPGLTHQGSRWRAVTEVLHLRPLAPEHAEAYLRQRGVPPELRPTLVDLAAGNALALSLAADLVLLLGARDLDAWGPRWRLAVHGLATQLLAEASDDELRQALEAACVVRRFDEDSLGAIAGLAETRRVFDRMAEMSAVYPTEVGLSLHEDVRSILAQDLRWRCPSRWEELRLRAVHHYRARQARAVDWRERALLLEEQLFLTHDALVHALLFPQAEPEELWLEPGGPEEWPEIRRLWRTWLVNELGGELLEGQVRALDMALDEPSFRVRVCRHRDGSLRGFNGVLPICQRTLPIFLATPNTAAFVSQAFGGRAARTLPADPEHATRVHFRFGVFAVEGRGAVQSLLLRDMLGLFARNLCYYVTTDLPMSQRFFTRLGFQRLPEASWRSPGAPVPHETYVLDLTRPGLRFPEWVDRVLSGLPDAEAPGASTG